MLIDFAFMKQVFFEVIAYLPVTVSLALLSIAAGIIIGIIIALIQIKKIPILRPIAAIYVSFMRGTPVIVQLYLVYFGLPECLNALFKLIGYGDTVFNPPAFVCAFLAFAFNSGAFLSVIFRSGILSVDSSQMEGAVSIGLTKRQTYGYIILPQAFRKVLPLLGNNFLGLIKGTSLAFSISVMEITAKAIAEGSNGLKFTESYIAAAIIYYMVCKLVEQLFRMAESRLSIY